MLLAGCGSAPRQPWDATADATEGYGRTLDAWTRKDEAYDALDARLFATATCASPTFQRALARRRAEHEGWPAARLDAALAEAALDAQKRLRCLVGVTPEDSHWDDAAPGGTLEFSLQTDAGPIAAQTVRKLSGDETADLTPYYLWLNPLQSAYLVDFPPQSAPERLVLRISGPPATIDLRWKMVR